MTKDILFFIANVFFLQAMPIRLIVILVICDALILGVKLMGWWE